MVAHVTNRKSVSSLLLLGIQTLGKPGRQSPTPACVAHLYGPNNSTLFRPGSDMQKVRNKSADSYFGQMRATYIFCFSQLWHCMHCKLKINCTNWINCTHCTNFSHCTHFAVCRVCRENWRLCFLE